MRALGSIAVVAFSLATVLNARARANAADALPMARARLYSKSSREVWETASRLASDLGLAVDRDRDHQLFDMWWQPFVRPQGGLKILPLHQGSLGDQLQLHVFVSPFAEPARVYVDAVVMKPYRMEKGMVHTENVELSYGPADISGWFFARLEERLGEQGRAIPTDFRARRRLTEEISGTASCEIPLSADGTTAGPVQAPRQLSRPKPIYPFEDRKKHHEAIITVNAAVGEDGAVHSARAEAGPDEDRMANAAVHAVTEWRYEPARDQGCAVPSVMKVRVTFSDR